jgi:exodeoxyribonuclease VII large subunit
LRRSGPPANGPQNEPLWGDLPVDDGPEPHEPGKPPDWALPAWDSIPADPMPAPRERLAPGKSVEPQRQVEAPRTVVEPRPVEPSPRVPESPRAAEPRAPEALRPSEPPTFALRILQVSEITRAVRDAVRTEPALRDVWVEGEVGRVTVSSAGHAYFTLKDERSQLACVFFRDDRVGSPFEARTGLRVVVHGRVDIFESQGVYQLYVASIQPAGFGDLALKFEALKAKLAAEGLFDSARKRPLPERPAVIGVATSATGAVWHDICHVITRRWPLARLVQSPCQVQGEGSAASVVAALDRLARWGEKCRAEGRPQDAPAVVILARGGGSLEDLWSFNDERVVRAVVAHPVPVVCGVGHEVDVTLADFAADVRAPTPSAAAELVVPDRSEIIAGLRELSRRSAACAARSLAGARTEVGAEGRALDRLRPSAQLAQARERAGYLLDRATRALRSEIGRRADTERRLAACLTPAISDRLGRRRAALERSAASLTALGPQATLDRGYAIVRRRSDGLIVRAPAQAAPGVGLSIRVAEGEIDATVERKAATASGKGAA